MANSKNNTGTLTVTFQGIDPDRTISREDILIRDKSGNRIDPLPAESKQFSFLLNPGTYTIGLGDVQPKTVLVQKDINVEVSFDLEQLAKINNVSTSETSVETVIVGQNANDVLKVQLNPSIGPPTDDQVLWKVIINDEVNNFEQYQKFINHILFGMENYDSIPYTEQQKSVDKKRLPFSSTEAYSLLKFATEEYVKFIYSVSNQAELKEGYLRNNLLPYYEMVLSALQLIAPNQQRRASNTDAVLIELIWNYWHEEGMVNQTINALARRFQNVKNGYQDPLANFELDSLRPLNNILWGYIQDAQHRLTPARRNYEYEHHYGLQLGGTPGSFSPADRRSKFLQSFHQLLYQATEYYAQSDNTIIRPDGFKLLNAIMDTHRIIAEGAHNQFGDLPTVARTEMLMEQWILARPEVREFLGGRVMVVYDEPWMDRVDSMKSLQRWDNTSISFYHDLAVYGEKIILGIRYGNWTHVTKREHATNWADALRDAIQRYIYCYLMVTGCDLSAQNVHTNPEIKFLLPGMLIEQKIRKERSITRRL